MGSLAFSDVQPKPEIPSVHMRLEFRLRPQHLSFVRLRRFTLKSAVPLFYFLFHFMKREQNAMT